MGHKKRNKPYFPNNSGVSKKYSRKESYLHKMLSSESEGNTNDFPRDSNEDYGEIVETSGKGVSIGIEDRHRIAPPISETQKGKSSPIGIILTALGLSITIILAIIGGVYKFGILETRVQENIKNMSDANQNISKLSEKITALSERVAKMEERGQYSQEAFESLRNMKKQVEEIDKSMKLMETQNTENEHAIQSITSQVKKIEADLDRNQNLKSK